MGLFYFRLSVRRHSGEDTMTDPTSPPLLIRAARPTDAEQLAVLINLPRFRHFTLRLPFHTPEEVHSWLERRPAGSPAVVACCGDVIVGSADLRRFDGRRAHVGEVGLGVHDDYAGRGIGSALLAALIEAGERWLGLTRLQLTVFTDNQRAIALYRRFGFEVEGTHRAYAFRDGTLADSYSMARIATASHLGGPPSPPAAAAARSA
jgi:putative acetyltransferase